MKKKNIPKNFNFCKYVVFKWWRKFAPLLDVSHTSQAVICYDDQLKPAFEHQITNSDKAMEKELLSSH